MVGRPDGGTKTLYINDAIVQNRIILSNLFPGTWNLSYSGVDSQGADIQGQEEVEIKEGYKYFAKSPSETTFTHRFNLEDIQINNREIIFTKISVEGEKRVAPSVLQVMKMGQSYEGIEMGGSIKVYYSKVN
ncbi:MAG: hypothetical protein IPG38_09320 [Chitinophagaceae bacterium]|nr:hypothetical protein [Chitinophagaceae bacterium]